MSKFKSGDKVETPFGVGIFYGYIDGGFMSGSLRVDYEKVQTGAVYFWNENDIKLYKTAHEKLLDLGFKHTEYNNYNTYKNDYITIDINTLRKWYNAHNVRNNKNYIDLELSRILTQYLEELEK